jgi:hypothetical protein
MRNTMKIDIKALRKQIRTGLDMNDLLCLLDRAIAIIPQDRLPEIIEGYLDLDELIVDDDAIKTSLIEEVRNFSQQSLAGVYYESFNVNSRNHMEQSPGTINWIDEFLTMMERCISESTATEPATVIESFDLLIHLLQEIDDDCDSIVFFADEGGAWQVWSSWEKLIPPYCQALAAIAKPKEYAQKIFDLIQKNDRHDSDQHFQQALSIANAPQKKALKLLMPK